MTKYESKYPTYPAGEPQSDVSDGNHTVAQLEAKARADRAAMDEKARSTATSVFDDGKPTGSSI
jgi:hypothetical protein